MCWRHWLEVRALLTCKQVGQLPTQFLCLPPSCSKEQYISPQYLVPVSWIYWPLSRLPVARGRQSPKYNIYAIILAIGPKLLQNPGTAINVAYQVGLPSSVLERGYLLPNRDGVNMNQK